MVSESEVGTRFIHPQHGVVEVAETRIRMVGGIDVVYAVLLTQADRLTIELPVGRFETVGIRPAMDEAEVVTLFEVLGNGGTEELRNWSRRFKDNEQRILSGDPLLVAEVVRSLTRRERERYLSHGEKRLLSRARHAVEAEIQLALNLTADEAARKLDDVLDQMLDSDGRTADT